MSLIKANGDTLDELERAKWKRVGKTLLKDWRLYALLIPMLVFLILFKYVPIYGVLQGFKRFDETTSVLKTQWTGLMNLKNLFDSSTSVGQQFWRAFRNTFVNSMYGLVFGFPIPIFIALLFTEIKNTAVRGVVQVCVYLPKFLSTVVTASIVLLWSTTYSPNVGTGEIMPGLLQRIFESLNLVALDGVKGHSKTSLLDYPRYFRPIYQITGVWEGAGYGSIVYFAAALAIDPTSFEAARIDGASKLQQIKYVTLPGMAPTLSIMLIIRIGQILNIGYEKVLLLTDSHTPAYETADVISTFVYRQSKGLQPNEPLGVVADLMNSLIAMCLVLGANAISRRVSSTSLF
ncbi:MAG: ABC transporter permease [Anaeroplasmataceae bacterium]